MKQTIGKRPARETVVRGAGICLCLAACAMGAAGCQDSGAGMGGDPQKTVPLTPIQDVAEFNREVIRSKVPVLVDFYKDACPTCVIQEGELEGLAAEYQGRVKFVKFKVREAYMLSSCPEFMDEHKLFWVPTTVLFVDGKEQQRWELNHLASEFRGALSAACAREPAPDAGATAKDNSPAASWPIAKPQQCVPGQGCPIDRKPGPAADPAGSPP